MKPGDPTLEKYGLLWESHLVRVQTTRLQAEWELVFAIYRDAEAGFPDDLLLVIRLHEVHTAHFINASASTWGPTPPLEEGPAGWHWNELTTTEVQEGRDRTGLRRVTFWFSDRFPRKIEFRFRDWAVFEEQGRVDDYSAYLGSFEPPPRAE